VEKKVETGDEKGRGIVYPPKDELRGVPGYEFRGPRVGDGSIGCVVN